MKHLFYLNKFLWKYRYTLILGTIFIVIANIFALYPAEFVRIAFDSVVDSLTKKTVKHEVHKILLTYSGLILLFAILKGIFMYFMRQTIIVMSRRIEFDLKNELYNHYQLLSMSFYKQNKTGDLMNRITEDINRVRMYIGPALMYAINITILFILVIGKMISISPLLTGFVLLPLPFLAISVYYASKKINQKSEKVQEQLSRITTLAQENYSGIKIIKSFGNEKNTLAAFVKNCKTYTKRQLDLAKIDALFLPLIVIMVGISTVLTVYVGGIESFKESSGITSGNIAEFIIYVNMLAWPVASIGWITSLVQRAEASQERINQFLSEKSEITNETNKNTPIRGDIHFRNVDFIYPETGIAALKNINIQILEGSTLGIFGKTGSGKSTFVNLLTRVYDSNNGEILFNKTKINQLNLNNLRKEIGYVPQDGYLFSTTIAENIGFSENMINYKEVEEAAKKAKVYDEVMKFPNKFNTLIGERGVQLSGGQRQRLAIARAFYKNPNIYIFDDCMSAIDANTEQEILENLKGVMKNKTTFLISHQISTLMMMDQIIVLDKGVIIGKGTHQELIKNNKLYNKIFTQQRNKNSDIN